jgi:hypothetical protein
VIDDIAKPARKLALPHFGNNSQFGYIKPIVQNKTLVDLEPLLWFYKAVPAGTLRCIASLLFKPIHATHNQERTPSDGARGESLATRRCTQA